MNTAALVPFVKWAGGKRQLLPQIRERLPENYRTYYEPFLGGGALLFDLHPEHAVVGDTNEALINTYRQIQKHPEELIAMTEKLDGNMEYVEGKEFYHLCRSLYNKKLKDGTYDLETAMLFLYLNRHCFNGLYRVNSRGEFNVPYNKSKRPSLDKENIWAVSEYLKSITIKNGDFERTCENAEPEDFVFLDSPYAPLNPESFTSYTKEGFGQEEHIRLAKLFEELTQRGCYCMLTNHNTDFIWGLYGDRGYRIERVYVKRLINADASRRQGEELIITNYRPPHKLW